MGWMYLARVDVLLPDLNDRHSTSKRLFTIHTLSDRVTLLLPS
jgi:hypothetical protein